MKLRHRIARWMLQDDNPTEMVERDEPNTLRNVETGIQFTVVNAAGGRIVQVQTFDRTKDRHTTSLHIITPEEDLAESLAHILALTQLSK